MTISPPTVPDADEALTAERVVIHIEQLIQSGQLKPGDRLPAERELARQVGVSRPSVRSGLHSLAALGIVESRHGTGSFITSGPPRLSSGPLSLLAALHGFTRDEMFEARRVLEVGAAGLAAERANGEERALMAEEVAGMFASLEDPQAFLVHDVRFHRSVALASHNHVLAALVEMVSALVYERRRLTVKRAKDLKESAEMHRRIYMAIRDKTVDRARQEMSEHLNLARMAQASEETGQAASDTKPPGAGPAPQPAAKKG
jgi:GntR family transcriptional regulator, transcriptional repressor for pyruvate dehydrogenase complex